MFGLRRHRRSRRGNRLSDDYWDPSIEALVPGPESGTSGHRDQAAPPDPEIYELGNHHGINARLGPTCPVSFTGNEHSISASIRDGRLYVWRNGGDYPPDQLGLGHHDSMQHGSTSTTDN
ncbi:hypothetical protein H2200_001119 [Cladophialophora chaetospira]|uniref:Uncharacterized protein n=1 Tax=Cladophialophora chaetospira TaxID=386627 RepID=A0AA38XKJ0_9EURO|nr:hypothetical protein H2200_001119 [Cladophialophora chaetospira]